MTLFFMILFKFALAFLKINLLFIFQAHCPSLSIPQGNKTKLAMTFTYLPSSITSLSMKDDITFVS